MPTKEISDKANGVDAYSYQQKNILQQNGNFIWRWMIFKWVNYRQIGSVILARSYTARRLRWVDINYAKQYIEFQNMASKYDRDLPLNPNASETCSLCVGLARYPAVKMSLSTKSQFDRPTITHASAIPLMSETSPAARIREIHYVILRFLQKIFTSVSL